MSSIEIRKYEYAEGNLRNYFDNPIYRDTLTLNEIMVEGYPIYNKEFEKQFDAFTTQASDITMRASLMQRTISSTGKTIEEFFTESINNHCLACKIDTDETFGGMVDIESITFNKTYAEGRYDIQFTMWGFEREFKQMGQRAPFMPTNGISPSFRFFLNNCFFHDGNTGYWAFDCSALDWVAKIGYEPYIVDELWQHLIEQGHTDDALIWDLFIDMVKFWGLVYKEFAITGTNGNFFRVEIQMIFRTNPSGTTITVQSETLEYGYIRNSKLSKWLFFKTAQNRDESTQFFGILSDGNNSSGHKFFARGNALNNSYIEMAYTSEDKLIINTTGYPPSNGFEVSQSDVTIITFSKYFDCFLMEDINRHWIFSDQALEYQLDPILSRKNYSFPALWTKVGYTYANAHVPATNADFRRILHADNVYALMSLTWTLIITEYQFLYKDFLYMWYKLRLSLINSGNIQLFTKTTVNGVSLILYKLTGKNLLEKKVDSLWYENRES